MAKQTCQNCYNNIRPTVGRILPMDECLEHNPDFGVSTTEFWQGNGTHNGTPCPHWQPKPKIKRW